MRAVVANEDGKSWVAGRVGIHLSPGARGICAVDDAGAVRGGVVYDGWTPNSVQAHMAADTPMAWRALLPHVFVYPFLGPKGDGVDGREVIMGMIRGSNTQSLKVARRFGFSELARVQNGFAVGEDIVLVELRREQCRWLKEAGHGTS